MMENISRKTGNVADFPLKMNLQLFAGEGEDYPQLEDEPEFNEDVKEYSKMDAKMDKYTEERTPKTEVKTENETVKAEEVVKPEVVEPEKPKQSHEDNKAFQEMRKQLEAQEEKAKRADKLIAQQYGHMGITTVEQYEQALQAEQEAKDNERYADAGLTSEEIQKLRDYDRIQQETSQDQQVRQQQEFTAKWTSLYTAYPELVESSKAFDDGKEPEWYTDEMKAEIARGASPIAAYRNAHFDTIMQRTLSGVKEAAEQDAMDKINSKDHLTPNATTGGEVDHVEIDPAQMAIYRKMTGKSDAEIRKFHKKQLVGG